MKRPLRTTATSSQRRVIFLVLPDVQLLDLAGPAQVFDTAARIFGAPYTLMYCATSNEIRSKQCLYLAHLERLPEVDQNDLILIAGAGSSNAPDYTLLDSCARQWLQESYTAGTQIASICDGALALGEAGLLHRRRCTTHWSVVSELRLRYPTAQVLEGVLYVHDHNIITSAGVASGIDMALWLLEQDCGPRLTADVARHLVVYLRRNGFERQVSVYLTYCSHLDPCVHRVQNWLAEHITESISLADLADMAHTSVRSLTRVFKAATGITPGTYQRLLRLELAAHLINDSNLPLETIAIKSGFNDPRHFRRVWHAHFGTPPSSGRQRSRYS
jgi:transcriptional regulator GlxA family with amidase domain